MLDYIDDWDIFGFGFVDEFVIVNFLLNGMLDGFDIDDDKKCDDFLQLFLSK